MRNLVSLLCTRNKRITSYYEVYDAKYIDVGDTLEDLDSIEGRSISNHKSLHIKLRYCTGYLNHMCFLKYLINIKDVPLP